MKGSLEVTVSSSDTPVDMKKVQSIWDDWDLRDGREILEKAGLVATDEQARLVGEAIRKAGEMD